jgi:hypothetical protein
MLCECDNIENLNETVKSCELKNMNELQCVKRQISDPRKYPLHDKELKTINSITIGNQAIAHLPDFPKTLLASLSHQ